MSEPRVPPALETLIRTVAGGSSAEDRDRRASTFARGLAIGALVGAAIAGSTIWQRRQTTTAIDRPRLGDGSDRPTDGPDDLGGPADGPTHR